ncbi:TetR/AcrR family transcriptional regulator [Dictyobacter arantiisoli]|uniref:HTH tetR-type domain-containing protein n=1 Tax=Dictyobacter arantiisoli TaxID=2014874 RepID=A0A5A5TFW2_9CHLR|nr:TetR/AcrR family transcriptional regulator [Dictyobacter arantiisoli]GCF10247.1 hypothetical protein KDI_38110 [Dictyobacter arantiisoli]
MTIHQSLKEKQRQERETLVLQAAQEVLLERGYHDTSMSEIAQRVGVAKGTLYQHFASKEDLVLTLFKRELQVLQDAMKQILKEQESVDIRLSHLVDEICRQIAKKHMLIFMWRESIDTGMELDSQLQAAFNTIHMNMLSLLDEGKNNGVFNAMLPTEVMLESLIGMIMSRLFKTLRSGKKVRHEDLVRYLKCIYFHGITAPASSSQAYQLSAEEKDNISTEHINA